MLQYKHTESRAQPETTLPITGGRHLVRKNIRKESRTDEKGAAFFMWVYDEAVANAAEYAAYVAVEAAELKREREIVDEYTLQLIDEGVL